jgi:hypothetical protein
VADVDVRSGSPITPLQGEKVSIKPDVPFFPLYFAHGVYYTIEGLRCHGTAVGSVTHWGQAPGRLMQAIGEPVLADFGKALASQKNSTCAINPELPSC